MTKYLMCMLLILGISVTSLHNEPVQKFAKVQDNPSLTTSYMMVDPGTG
ncbi:MULTISPECIES: hypothetical protein [Bacillus cereus group]|uniref:Uncharacterized protein n=3 Tax=Bacillus cereus TaxID=1396 RepID=A0A9W5KRA8_BACCE|nr:MULTISPECIES: hypothetical protein [Bacillus cereus group]EJR90775.1 hypothetical protein IKG_05897 [Bacillus cereus VD200]EJR63305.1 hypothetical protein IK5_05846 [Bacillus cereus VD154]EOO62465.1 hypothetical protein IKE_05642 [Bacillus cereus VD196]MBJ8042949.1 hypothetical protein [Bacillus cereus group sp. N17]MCU4733562.1 hypothetical protein [Bacillus cereus]